LFKPNLSSALGAKALESLRTHLPDPESFASCFGLPESLARAVYDRTAEKLTREPVEDFRIDFEDGYGIRSDEEEDAHALSAAAAVKQGPNPLFLGIRIKPFTAQSRTRALRTLKLFMAKVGSAPENFVVTLPKVTDPEQVTALIEALEEFGSPMIELMIETPLSIIDASGQFAIPKLIHAARGRCRGLHFGAYDYTASCEIVAEHQTLTHPACDFARHVMQVSAAGRNIMLSDGATNILPVAKDGAAKKALRLHFDNVQRALANGYYQGWDLHPAQLPARYAAVYAFFLRSFESAAERMRNFTEKSARATMTGGVFDDAATVEGILNFFRRGLNCGAFSREDLEAAGIGVSRLG